MYVLTYAAALHIIKHKQHNVRFFYFRLSIRELSCNHGEIAHCLKSAHGYPNEYFGATVNALNLYKNVCVICSYIYI